MAVSWGQPLTVEDLEGFPDDGRRYELLDGMLLVTPAPGSAHQTCVLSMGVALHGACPRDLRVFVAPFDWVIEAGTLFQPDVLVARRADITPNRLEAAPLLCVEVLSRSTRLTDLNLKRAAYERAGVPAYWIVDPEVPSLTVLRLGDDGRYVEVARVEGDEAYEADFPFPVPIVPARLLD